MIEAYPLSWPLGHPRTAPEDRQRARFGTRDGWSTRRLTIAQARSRLLSEIGRYGRVPDDSLVISTNVPTRKDGLPYSNAREPDDPAACVYFELDDFPVALPCDTFDRVADNIAAIAGHIEADRRQERYGVAKAAQRYAGFKALPEKGSGEAWWGVLGVSPEADPAEVRTAYRRLVKDAHPDTGGDRDKFDRVQEAYRQAMSQT